MKIQYFSRPRLTNQLGVLLVGIVLLQNASHAQTKAKYEPQGDSVYHGASLPEFWSEKGLQTQKQNFEKQSGQPLAVITWFGNLYQNGRMTFWSQSYAPLLKRVKEQDAVSLIKFSTQDSNFAQTGRQAKLKQITAGVYDDYFRDAASTVKRFGSPVFISINHEMNGSWYPYSEAYPNSEVKSADFVAAWRHIVDIFRKEGANNVAWVWSPNAIDVGPVPAHRYYPGDKYVDWIGVSFYSSNSPTELDSLYRTHSQRKPFFITEWGTSAEKSRFNPKYPGDAAWVKQFFDALETRYKRVKAISWFQWKAGDGDYTLERDAEQRKAYAERIKKARYVGKVDAK